MSQNQALMDMIKTKIIYYDSPIGVMELISNQNGLVSCCFDDKRENIPIHQESSEVVDQLDEYFTGKRTVFDVRICPEGTAFRKKVWKMLEEIPYGKTSSYLDVATKIGDPKASRAVGNANGKNPLPIIVPCHRVIGTDGSLTGFSGGILRKKWLLEFESPARQGSLF